MNKEYKIWVSELKQKILSAQIKAGLAVNIQMIQLYWDIGKSIAEKQENHQWGSKVVEQLASDLRRELPDTNGFSRTNLFEMRRFYLFYNDCLKVHQVGGLLENGGNESIVHQVGGLLSESILCQIPWRHHIEILRNCNNNPESALFYIQETVHNNWSRNFLILQIESQLFERRGKAQNNFEVTLPKVQSDLARETLKDPYKFDFLTLEAEVQELEFEKKLIENITKFLLELGKGFAYVGRQYPIKIGNRERKIDLLFYHLKMHCYIVIDLKMGEFEPEYAGKMNYYLSAIDNLLKTEIDQPSLGLILCKTKDSVEVEYALKDISKPMGISEFKFNELPKLIQDSMPTVEEIENELKNLNDE